MSLEFLGLLHRIPGRIKKDCFEISALVPKKIVKFEKGENFQMRGIMSFTQLNITSSA
mgnify:FL=1